MGCGSSNSSAVEDDQFNETPKAALEDVISDRATNSPDLFSEQVDPPAGLPTSQDLPRLESPPEVGGDLANGVIDDLEDPSLPQDMEELGAQKSDLTDKSDSFLGGLKGDASNQFNDSEKLVSGELKSMKSKFSSRASLKSASAAIPEKEASGAFSSVIDKSKGFVMKEINGKMSSKVPL